MLFAGLCTKNITGKVTSLKDASPLAAVSVVVKNGRSATQTDANGNFSLSAPANGRIIFSLVGYKTFETVVPFHNTLEVVLEESEQQLSEVVVTALGIRKNKKALGYAVSIVDPNNVLQRPDPDIAKGLQGKEAGVDIRTSHRTPGGAIRIQIIGNSSFGLDTDPLIVVDGIPYSNDILATGNQDIILFYTENKMVFVLDTNGKKYTAEKTLTELEEILDSSRFFRANRQYIININFIKGFKAFDKVKMLLDLTIPGVEHSIIISQENCAPFKKWMYDA